MAHSIRLERVGYEVHELTVRPILRWSVLRHLLLGSPSAGALRTAADLSTGKSQRLHPRHIDVVLRRARAAAGLLGG